MYSTKIINGGETTVIHSRLDSKVKILNGTLTESVNTIPTYSFDIYPGNPGYELIEVMRTKAVFRDVKAGEDIFIGRVYSISDKMSESGEIYKSVICEGELAYLCDVLIPYAYYSAGTLTNYALKNIIDMYNERADADKQFSVGTIETDGNYEVIEERWVSAWELLMKFCEIYHGEIRLTYDSDGTRRISFSHEFGSLSKPDIALSVNLKTLQRSIDPSALATRFYPVGGVLSSGKRLTMSPYADSKDYFENTALQELYGTHEAVKIYDIGNEDSTQQEIPYLAHDLKAAGEVDFEQIGAMDISFKITALDLSPIDPESERYKLYNTHRIITKLQGIDDKVRIIGTVLYQDRPWDMELTFGTKTTTLTSMLAYAK